MINFDINYQYIVWSHNELDYEPFKHDGTLSSYLLIPSVTLGLSDYINFNYRQITGIRSMDFSPDEESIHHRDEDTTEPFKDQAEGGFFGDARLKLRYLYKNAGMKEGLRAYFGLGLLIPSKSVLKENPYLTPDINPDWYDENDEILEEHQEEYEALWTEEYEHRHFSLSDGVYKGLIELQLFKKRMDNPVFLGSSLNLEVPFSESKYGYKPGLSYSIISSLVYKLSSESPALLPKGIVYGLSFLGTEEAFWNGGSAWGSNSKLLVPSLGLVWSTEKGSVSMNINKPIFLKGSISSLGSNIENDKLNNKANAFEFVIGYRRNLGYVIPWL